MLTGEIYRYADHIAALVKPAADISAYAVQHIEVKLAYVRILLQNRYELHRRNYPAVSYPAAESLCAYKLSCCYVYFRLIEYLELFVFQCLGEQLLYLHALFSADFHGVVVEYNVVLAAHFCSLQCGKDPVHNVAWSVKGKVLSHAENACIC